MVAGHVPEVGGEQVSFDATSDAQSQLRECSEQHKKGGNDRRFERHPIPNDTTTQDVGSGVEMKQRDSSKLDERRGNVYENKGSAFHDPQRSGNVYENTST
jgi:hypothetical protein